MKKLAYNVLFLSLIILTPISLFGQVTAHIGDTSETSPLLSLSLTHRFQKNKSYGLQKGDNYDRSINSPKSVKIIDEKKKFYVHSLEGYITSVYCLDSFTLLKTIKHKFDNTNQALFRDTFYFNQAFRTKSNNWNEFKGKPVESCLTHNGKYLWVTYYRRSYDANAIDPSAVCIIDTDTDSIVRVLPTGPLPKMITSSNDNKYIAISHWGNNTVALIDIQGKDPKDFHYINELLIDKKMNLNYSKEDKIDRDQGCGACLRGTVFSLDSKYLFVGKMGGNSIAIIDIENKKYLGDIKGMRGNLRHIIISNGWLYLSINKYGYLQRTPLIKFVEHFEKNDKPYTQWEEVYVGTGARTIEATSDGKFIFCCVNNESKLVVVNSASFQVETTISVDSYPVGLALSKDNQWAITTSQGKSSKGGNSVCVFKINFE